MPRRTVFIPVNDMPTAIAWYSRLFGLEHDAPLHEGLVCVTSRDPDSNRLMVYEPRQDAVRRSRASRLPVTASTISK